MNKPSPIIKFALIGMMFMAIAQTKQGTTYINDKISDLPVYGKQETATDEPKKQVQPNPDLVKNLVPILVESAEKSKLDADTNNTNVLDDKLSPPEEAKAKAVESTKAQEPTVPAIDVGNILDQMSYDLVLDATTKNGAIISGVGYTVGDKVQVSGVAVGTLDLVTDSYVVVTTPKKKIKLYLGH